MTLRARLTLGFLAISILLLIPLVISLRALSVARDDTNDLREGDFTASQVVGSAIRALAGARAAERLYPITEITDGVPSWEAPLVAALDTVAGAANMLVDLGDDLEPDPARLGATVDSLRRTIPQYREAVLAGDDTLLDSLSGQVMLPLLDVADSTVLSIAEKLQRRSGTLAQDTAERVSRALDFTQWAIALSVLLAAGVAVQITRSISRPVRELERGMQAVADGDFRRPLLIAPGREDEFGRLAGSYHEMARRLAELDKLKAEFVSVASHELKTPINVILGYLQLLDEGLYGPLTPRQREVVATLSAQGQSLARLVQQLLDISRFEAGGGRLELRDLDLESFVAELETAFHVLALQREIRFRVEIGADVPATVHWDPDRMNEVLGNLLSNAFKFTERGGRVDLEVSNAASGLLLVVRDTGAGIAPSQLPHVFRKFFQADNQASASMKGTGLGLAISKEIVEAHDGEITVDSTPGAGTTFLIVLPVRARVRRATGGPVTPVALGRVPA